MPEYVLEKPEAGLQPVNLSSFNGAITGLHGDVLQGWAMDTAHPEQRLIIEVCIDGASVALARADQYDPDAAAGDHFHGFTVQLKQAWLDEARLITANVANQAHKLEGDIKLPAAPSQDTAIIASQVWHTGGLRVSGWSWDPQAPQRHVQITLREGHRVVGEASCNTHHQALVYRTTSDHGFTLDLPWELADGKLHVIDVVNDRGQALSGSPIRLCYWPEGLEGLLRQYEQAPSERPWPYSTKWLKNNPCTYPRAQAGNITHSGSRLFNALTLNRHHRCKAQSACYLLVTEIRPRSEPAWIVWAPNAPL